MASEAIAENLLRIRKDRGLTQDELAAKIGLSRGSYRNIEKARAMPHPKTLRALANVLGVSRKDLVSPVRTLKQVRFRSLKRLKSRQQVLSDISRWLEDFSDLEAVTGQKIEHGLKPLWRNVKRRKNRDIPAIAAMVREAFRRNEEEPIHDICGLLESVGIKVYSIEVKTDAFMGLSVSEEDGGPAVVVNTWDRLPVEVWIYSAAHELGHLLLHIGAYDVNEELEDDAQEAEANEFASHFLMPQAAFRKEWEDAGGLPLVDRVFKVKRMFRVSWKTVLYRVAQDHPAEQRGKLWARFNFEYKRRKGSSLLKHDEPEGITREIYQRQQGDMPAGKEPEGMKAHDFQQDRMGLLVRKAVEEDLISLSRAAEILRIPLEQMRDLTVSWQA